MDAIARRQPRRPPCFDAASWVKKFQQQRGWQRFSQGYQDSVLESLFDPSHLGTVSKSFVEFGFHLDDVNGTANRSVTIRGRHPRADQLPAFGSNTELLKRRGWSGVRFDGDEENLALVPDLHHAFITPQNVAATFRRHGVPSDVDYVSIDVDSCDLWVFLAMADVYRPTVVTVEYNSNYRFNESVTNTCVDVDAGEFFTLQRMAELTGQYWGWSASLLAFDKAARRRGYNVVWVEPFLDVFMVRSDRICQPAGVPSLERFRHATGRMLHGKPQGNLGPMLSRKWTAEYL